MELKTALTSIFALVFVTGLIWIFSFLLRKYGASRLPIKLKGKGARISITEAMIVDARRKLLLVRCDDKEHLILIGPESDLLVESGIKPKENDKIE